MHLDGRAGGGRNRPVAISVGAASWGFYGMVDATGAERLQNLLGRGRQELGPFWLRPVLTANGKSAAGQVIQSNGNVLGAATQDLAGTQLMQASPQQDGFTGTVEGREGDSPITGLGLRTLVSDDHQRKFIACGAGSGFQVGFGILQVTSDHTSAVRERRTQQVGRRVIGVAKKP